MTCERPTVTTHNGVTIILVPNADKSLAINMRTLTGGTFRIGYIRNPTPEHADAALLIGIPAEVVESVRSALAQRFGE
jgi:hypothetical protein